MYLFGTATHQNMKISHHVVNNRHVCIHLFITRVDMSLDKTNDFIYEDLGCGVIDLPQVPSKSSSNIID